MGESAKAEERPQGLPGPDAETVCEPLADAVLNNGGVVWEMGRPEGGTTTPGESDTLKRVIKFQNWGSAVWASRRSILMRVFFFVTKYIFLPSM